MAATCVKATHGADAGGGDAGGGVAGEAATRVTLTCPEGEGEEQGVTITCQEGSGPCGDWDCYYMAGVSINFPLC